MPVWSAIRIAPVHGVGPWREVQVRGRYEVVERIRLRVLHGPFEVEAEGPQELVERYVQEEIASWAGTPLPAAPTGTARTDGAGQSIGGGQRLKEFHASKKPDGHLEIATVLAYWAKMNENKQALSGAELEDLYKRAEIKRPADATNTMAKSASHKGWFRNAGEGRYEITAAGEDHVVHDMPAGK
jgi:hypothetical protein